MVLRVESIARALGAFAGQPPAQSPGTGWRVSGDVPDSANAKGSSLSVARSECLEFKDAAAVCGWARSGFDPPGPVSDLPAVSASTLQIALSRDRRSFAIADSESGG